MLRRPICYGALSAFFFSAFLFFPTTVSLAQSSADAPKLIIEQATYGDLPDGEKVDVTPKVVAKVKDNKVWLEVNNELFTDPAEGVGKKLKVVFRVGESKGEATVPEGETLILPVPVLKGELKIVKAVYGDTENGLVEDVTEYVASRLKNGEVEVEVNNDVFGDPASGAFKRLRVEYSIGDVKLVKSTYEGGTFHLRMPK